MSKPTQRKRSRAQAEPTSSKSHLPMTVSARWLVGAICIVIAAAIVCTWGALCLIFWQGSWQLLYHPRAPITRTPAIAGIGFDNVEFGPSPAGVPQLKGWWIPSATASRYTALFLHGATGNLSDTVDTLAALHEANLSVLAFDYRGYGQSEFMRPNETRWREDATAAIQYLEGTRHIPAKSLVLAGTGLGANLALQIAATNPDFAGVVLEDPLESPMEPIFRDPRASMVPARALVRDRWETRAAATSLRIPSLWFYQGPEQNEKLKTFECVSSRKAVIWLKDPKAAQTVAENAISRWLDDLPGGVASR